MRFLVESRLNQAPTPEIMALFPAEMAHGEHLQAQGVRLHLFVAADNSAAWQVFQVNSPAELEPVLQGFPLALYTHSVVTPLAEAAPTP